MICSCQLFAQESKNCSLTGKITDLLGNPLPDATIELEDKTKAKVFAIIDEEGNYSVKELSCGQININYTHANFYKENLTVNLTDGVSKLVNLGLAIGREADPSAVKCRSHDLI